MPAYLTESDIPAVVDLLSRLHALDPQTIPRDLTADEIEHISRRRRQALVDALENKGLIITPPPAASVAPPTRGTDQ